MTNTSVMITIETTVTPKNISSNSEKFRKHDERGQLNSGINLSTDSAENCRYPIFRALFQIRANVLFIDKHDYKSF